MKKRVHILHIIVVILLIILVVPGCQAAKKPRPYTVTEKGKPAEKGRTTEERKTTEVNHELIKSEAASDALVGLTGIDDATVLFWHNQAIVAVNVPEGKEGVTSEELRKKIIDTVKSFDEKVTRIDITADKSLFYELDSIKQTMIRGEQTKNIDKDINNILNRINNKK